MLTLFTISLFVIMILQIIFTIKGKDLNYYIVIYSTLIFGSICFYIIAKTETNTYTQAQKDYMNGKIKLEIVYKKIPSNTDSLGYKLISVDTILIQKK